MLSAVGNVIAVRFLTMKTQQPFFTIRRIKPLGLFSFRCYTGNASQKRQLLQHSMEALEQIFTRRAAKACAKRVFDL